MSSITQPVLVAACGNAMAGDDAFGPLVAERMRTMDLADVEIVDLGMKPAGLLNHLASRQGVIVVDAAEPAEIFPAGSLIDVDFFSSHRPQLRHDAALSSHGLSIAHELELARRLQMLPPRVHLVAASVSHADVGSPISDVVLGLVQPAADRARQLAFQWLAQTGTSCHA